MAFLYTMWPHPMAKYSSFCNLKLISLNDWKESITYSRELLLRLPCREPLFKLPCSDPLFKLACREPLFKPPWKLPLSESPFKLPWSIPLFKLACREPWFRLPCREPLFSPLFKPLLWKGNVPIGESVVFLRPSRSMVWALPPGEGCGLSRPMLSRSNAVPLLSRETLGWETIFPKLLDVARPARSTASKTCTVLLQCLRSLVQLKVVKIFQLDTIFKPFSHCISSNPEDS